VYNLDIIDPNITYEGRARRTKTSEKMKAGVKIFKKKMSPIDSASRVLQNEYHIMGFCGFYARGQVAKALGLHSKGAGSIPTTKSYFFI
jgi:dihydroxyacid dehydratase/phosphogluconate dehydratase